MSKKDWEEIDFEIEFLEGVVEASNDFVDALKVLADHYTHRGFYEKGLELDLRLARLEPRDPVVHYNLACSYSLLGNAAAAFKTLCAAVTFGFSDMQLLTDDPDLDQIRDDPRFEAILAAVRNRKLDENN